MKRDGFFCFKLKHLLENDFNTMEINVVQHNQQIC